MKKIFRLALFCVSLFSVTPVYSQSGVPVYDDNDIVLSNFPGRYTYKYLPEYKIPHWVAYYIVEADLQSNTTRSSGFTSDRTLREMGLPLALSSDYTSTGFDRGHMLPSADRLSSKEANKSTFVMSNVAPQVPSLNRGVWKTLEERVRDWAEDADTVFVVCGAIMGVDMDENTQAGVRRIGNGVGVPIAFFKALRIVDQDEETIKCYIFDNGGKYTEFQDYNVSLDSLERRAQIDLIWNNEK